MTVVDVAADAVGHAPPLPSYAALFWQCRLRYRTSQIAQDIAAGYHERNLSLGVLVIDFMYATTLLSFFGRVAPKIPAVITTVRAGTSTRMATSG